MSADTSSGVVRSSLPQVIHVYNAGTEQATGVTVTFTPPKGAKVDGSCLVDHQAGGVRSYTCLLGDIGPGVTADVRFSVSMTKAGDASFYADAICDQGSTAGTWVAILIGQ